MKKLKISLPEAWNNLSDRQLRQTALLFNSAKRGILFDVALLQILLDIRWWHFRKKGQLYLLLRNVTLTELKKHYAYLYKTPERTRFIDYMITKDEAYFSPQERLQNLSAEEFSIAEDLHKVWHKKRERVALEYLAAVLYSTAPNVRPLFEKDALEVKAKEFKSVPLADLLAMEMTYRGCKERLVNRYPKAFSTSGGQSKGNSPGFGKVIDHMAGGKFGDHEKTRRTNIYVLLDRFEQDLKDQAKLKQNGKRNIA